MCILEILKLVEFIYIVGNLPNNGRFVDNLILDSEFYFESIRRNGSFTDIIRLINTEIAKQQGEGKETKEDNDAIIKNILFPEQRYKQLSQVGYPYPVEYIYFLIFVWQHWMKIISI